MLQLQEVGQPYMKIGFFNCSSDSILLCDNGDVTNLSHHEKICVKPEDVLIVVGHAHRKPWAEIALNGQCKTWVPHLLSNGFNVAYIFSKRLPQIAPRIDFIDMRLRYESGPYVASLRNLANTFALKAFQNMIPRTKSSFRLFGINDLMFIESLIPDLYMSSRWKRLSILKFFINRTNFKYLVFTTTSSYINGNQLLYELQSFPSNCVGGRVMQSGLRDSFISGSFSVYTRNVAEALVSARHEMNVSLLDDVSFGHGQRKIGIPNYEMSSIDISNENELKQLEQRLLDKMIHFRLKSITQGARQDAYLMKELHKRLNHNLNQV
jgi:hypothetical protein